jgi:hypothetical protein
MGPEMRNDMLAKGIFCGRTWGIQFAETEGLELKSQFAKT